MIPRTDGDLLALLKTCPSGWDNAQLTVDWAVERLGLTGDEADDFAERARGVLARDAYMWGAG